MTLPPLSLRARIIALTAATAVLATVAVGYTVAAADGDGRSPESVAAPGLTLDNAPGLFHAARKGNVRSAPYSSAGTGAADGARSRNTGLSCDRFYASGRSAVCIASHPGISQKTKVNVLDRELNTRKTVVVGGIPNRARVSPSGRMVAWTLFVSGDSYASSSFSTRSGILDTRTGYLVKNVETLQLYLEGRRYHAPDVNYWGITFADDDNRFYATVATKGKTYLVEGDIKTWKARTLRRNVECPSLSPDGTRIAFKKRVREGARNPWRLHVLDLKTMRETPVAETRSVDDQAAWLDDSTLAYALPGRAKGTSDIWTVPADASAAEPSLLLSDASSPSLVVAGG
ncbi:TolB family protein [Streptomyces anulatus]